jgi:hypothetical protein
MTHFLPSYLEVIKAAQQRTHFEDFKTGGRLSGDIRQGYQARMAAFRDLSSQGFVTLESSRIVLGELTPAPWLTSAIQSGSLASWEICDAFPQKLRKFKPEDYNLQEIGLEGELFVVEWLEKHLDEDLRKQIEHTSLKDDSAGFDISSPNSQSDSRIFLEVKTTTRQGDDFTFHLSRNEWNTAARLQHWYLVLVKKVEGQHTIFGYLNGQSLVNYYPQDSHPDFHWESVVGKLSSDDVFSGFPGF